MGCVGAILCSHWAYEMLLDIAVVLPKTFIWDFKDNS